MDHLIDALAKAVMNESFRRMSAGVSSPDDYARVVREQLAGYVLMKLEDAKEIQAHAFVQQEKNGPIVCRECEADGVPHDDDCYWEPLRRAIAEAEGGA